MFDLRNRWGGAGRAAQVTWLVGAVLVSGCFNASPSVKQAMTSGAPVAAPATTSNAGHGHGPDGVASLAGAARAKGASFDLDKPAVRTSIATFQSELRDFFDGALARSAKYVPTMSSMLAHAGLPTELAYLPLIESGYRPLAISRAGAVGPWQFIPETGKKYGLRIDSMVDERRDPIKSTAAAAQYLKDLHEMFGDWELSLAAYNGGENRVARILAAKGAQNFWSMRDRGYLPNETSQYVPRFLAAVSIAKAPQEYGFVEPEENLPYHFEVVNVDRQVSLSTAAGLCGVSASELADLNPALRRGITPSGYALRVPAGAAEPLRTALASYVEPARATRQVVRAGRGTARGSIFAKRNEARRIATAPLRSVRTYGSRKAARPLVREASRAGAVGRSRRKARPSVRVARAGEPSPFAKPPAKTPARARRRSG